MQLSAAATSASLLLASNVFAILYMKQPLKLDYLWAPLCIMGAVYSIFRG
ncbi:MAG: DMT family protein [Pseudomonadota bacterium]|nr:DMT family protein [Pseudomonadota bacterium]